MEQVTEFIQGMDFTAKTFAGLEEPLAEELKKLGADNVKIIKRGATFKGDEELMYKVNYLSRLAIRILKPIGVFEVKSDEQLYEKVRKINWMNVFKLDQTFSVEANLFYSDLNHTHYAALKTKDAIVDQFRESTGKRPWVNVEKPDIYVDVHISHNVCTISLDSSGESLHRRGYRIEADKAPINEVLAAGMINLSGWKGDTDFYDPMCGSGTIPMEAAMLAMNIPAGYYRKNFALMNWEGYNENLWKKVKEEADKNMGELDCRIFASDRSEKAVGITKRNLKHAGLHKDIEIRVAYFDSIVPEKGGILIMNPPYGIRMEERGELRDLYKGIGNVLKQNFKGFEAWIISPDFDTTKFIGLRPSQKITLYNGPLETRFLKFEVYEGTRRYGNTPGEKTIGEEKQEFRKKDNFRASKDQKEDGRKRDFDKGKNDYRSSNNAKTEDRQRNFREDIDKPESENRREVIEKRSRDFDRHMESLRRFTKSDSKKPATKKPGGRKRISDKESSKDEE